MYGTQMMHYNNVTCRRSLFNHRRGRRRRRARAGPEDGTEHARRESGWDATAVRVSLRPLHRPASPTSFPVRFSAAVRNPQTTLQIRV